MSDRNTVHVSNIAAGTTEKEVRDFFSFWYVFSTECYSYNGQRLMRFQWENHVYLSDSRVQRSRCAKVCYGDL